MLCKLTIFKSKKQKTLYSYRKKDKLILKTTLKTIRYLLFLITFFVNYSFAQNPVSHNFNIENGLPSNTVYYSLQDSKGYIWFATDKGIVRYNGSEFENFTSSDGLSDNEFFDIYEDSKHRIWFASYNGEPSFYENGKFYSKENCSFLNKIDFEGPGLKIMEDKNRNLFYLTYFKIYKIDKANKVSIVKSNSVVYSALIKNKKNEVIALTTDFKKNILLNLTNSEIYSSKTSQNIHIGSKGFSSEKTVLYFVRKMIYEFSDKTKKTKEYEICDEENSIQCGNYFQNYFWIGTSSGFFKLKNLARKNEKTNSKSSAINNHFFKGISISSINEDRDGNIWITTLKNGIYLIINQDIHFLNKDNNLGFDNSFSILKISNSQKIIGSENSLFSLINSNKIKTIQLSKNHGFGIIKQAQIYKNYLYVSSGLYFSKLDLNGKILKEIKLAVKDFYITKKDSVYLVGGGSFSRFHLKDLFETDNYKTLESKYVVLKNIKSSGIYVFKNEIYIYGLFGVKQYKNNKTTELNFSKFLKKNILAVKKTPDEIIWCASTVNGLIAIYKDKVYRFTTKNGLPSNYVTSISLGEKNSIWIGTLNGLSKISYKKDKNKIEIQAENFTVNNGLLENSINDLLFDDDTLYLASSKGICYFSQSSLFQKKIIPSLIVKSILVNHKKVELKNNIVFNADQNNFEINIQGFSYKSLGQISYKYRLKGLDDTWKYTNRPKLEYPSLNKGKYQLEIVAIDVFKNESKPIIYSFSIWPYFYETWWFILIIVSLSLFIIYFSIKYQLNKISKNLALKEKLLTLENDKLRIEKSEISLQKEFVELEQKALLLQMNPHFIFNSINTIQGLYRNDREKADEYLVRFSNLLRQILEFSKVQLIPIDQEISFLTNYLEINKLRFENKYSFEIIIDQKINTTLLGISPLILQPFIENALIHGIQALKTEGKIQITFKLVDDFIVCTIKDNGIGREKSKTINRNRIHNSLGMEITEKRLNNFNNIKSSIEIEDLYDENNNSIGTKIIVLMKTEDYY